MSLSRIRCLRPAFSFLAASKTLTPTPLTLFRWNSSSSSSSFTFGEMSQTIFKSAQGERNANLMPESDIAEDSNNITTDELVKKGENILKAKYGPDYKVKPNLSRNLRTILESQPSNRNYWLSLFAKRSDLFSVPYNVFPNLGYLADFMIVQLGFSKRATFNLLNVLSTSFIFAKYSSQEELEDFWHRPLSNWLALCDKFQISKTDSLALLTNMPEILAIEPDLWDERLDQLRWEYFKEKSTLKALILNAGSMIFLDPWDHLQEKLEYIIKVMHVDIRDLAECGAVLYHDLEHIETRFMFLDRAGLYKHPSAKALGTSKSAFPLISDVVGGTDEEFLEKVAGKGLTIDEYQTFREILRSEKGFESSAEKECHHSFGYFDESVREDEEEAEEFRRLNDRTTFKETK